MALSDKTLTCVECGYEFTFTTGEQEFFASKGFTNEPSRCPQCRAARKGHLNYGLLTNFGGWADVRNNPPPSGKL